MSAERAKVSRSWVCLQRNAGCHETIRHFFDRELPEPEAPLRDITVMDAIRLLRMYQKKGR